MFGLTKYYTVCGIDIKKGTGIKRFGKYLCSDEHAIQYVERKMEEEKRMEHERKESHERRGGCC